MDFFVKMNCHISFNRYFTYLLLFSLYVSKSWSKSYNANCGENHLIHPKGTISSPFYPVLYPYEVYCTWHILSPPQSLLKIHIRDFDIPDDSGCDRPPCCRYNYISLPVNGTTDDYVHICGNMSQSVITVSQIHTTIIFRYSSPSHHGRGFQLTYSIEKNVCNDKFRCRDGSCLHMSKRCDGIPQCTDGEDEMLCTESSKCAEDEVLCGPLSDSCFKEGDKCDGIFQCPYGEDETGCYSDCESNGIKCQTVGNCYLPSQRCDGHSDCIDDSDESMCPDELCPSLPNKRQCHNGRCIQAKLWCDGNDDCGDFSDEEACLKNSMITIAMMGALLGGLFLVLAVGCSLRIYSRRCSGNNCQLRLSPPGLSRLRMPHSLSLPALIDNEFFHREPPPMYSVAVGNAGLPRRSRGNRSRGSSRRSNHTHRHTVAVPVPKPPSENILNDSSSPSSEDSLLSSSNVQVTNTDDSEQLISA